MTRHKNKTPEQVRARVANIFFGSIIIAGLFMSYGAYVAQQVFANDLVNQTLSTKSLVKQDDNLVNQKPTTRWRLNSNGYSQRYVELSGSNRVERMHSLLQAYWHDNYQVWETVARIYRVYPEALICIAYADSSLGRFLKTENNLGNVGNNDRWDRVAYSTIEAGINAIGKTLNNRNLSYIYTINYLSRYGNKTGMVYATSPENQFINMANCLGMIHNKKIDDKRNFRR